MCIALSRFFSMYHMVHFPVYIHMYTYKCICEWIHAYFSCKNTYLHPYTCIFQGIYICIHTNAYANEYIHAFKCKYIYLYPCTYIYVQKVLHITYVKHLTYISHMYHIYRIYKVICTDDPIWGDIFECCFKAQSSKLERLFSLKRGKRDVRALSYVSYISHM